MKKIVIALNAALLLGAALLSAGCEGFGQKGRPITFVTVTGEVGTKTTYGDDYAESTTTWQFIDWVTGDRMRIVSDYASDQSEPANFYADYKVTAAERPDGTHQSKATVESASASGHGLFWDEGHSGSYNFYAVYPTPGTGAVNSIGADAAPGGDATPEQVVAWQFQLGRVNATLPASTALPEPSSTKKVDAQGHTLPDDATDFAHTYNVYAPDMNYAVMTAAASVSSSNSDVDLLFKPAFTAFEFNLTTAQVGDEFTIYDIRLTSTGDDYLTGTYSMKAGADLSGSNVVTVDGTERYQYAALTSPAGVPLAAKAGITCTLFTLPKANTGILTLKITTEDGTVSLPLTGTDGTNPTSSAYIFQPGLKYRINLLKLNKRDWTYKITLAPGDYPWDRSSQTTTFSQNIQADKFEIENAKETGNNYYPAGTKQYQVRTLDMDNGKTYFVVKFKPKAPLGGYWQLIPESNGGLGTGAFKVEVWDTEEDEGSSDLKGQIMNQTVTLHVTCNVTDDQRTEDHAIIIKGIFSTSADFDDYSTYNADSELQDVHKDGSFSYWRFVIPAKNN